MLGFGLGCWGVRVRVSIRLAGEGDRLLRGLELGEGVVEECDVSTVVGGRRHLAGPNREPAYNRFKWQHDVCTCTVCMCMCICMPSPGRSKARSCRRRRPGRPRCLRYRCPRCSNLRPSARESRSHTASSRSPRSTGCRRASARRSPCTLVMVRGRGRVRVDAVGPPLSEARSAPGVR